MGRPAKRLRMDGLKARNMIAQGEALGKADVMVLRPERALQKLCDSFVLPLQGKYPIGRQTQGVALGFHVAALSARNTVGSIDTHYKHRGTTKRPSKKENTDTDEECGAEWMTGCHSRLTTRAGLEPRANLSRFDELSCTTGGDSRKFVRPNGSHLDSIYHLFASAVCP